MENQILFEPVKNHNKKQENTLDFQLRAVSALPRFGLLNPESGIRSSSLLPNNSITQLLIHYFFFGLPASLLVI